MGLFPGSGMIFMSDKRLLEFVDTNILVYAHDLSAGEKHASAQALLQRLWETGNGCLSVQILQEFYVTVTRKVTRPLPIAEAAEIIRDLSFWQIHNPTAEDVLGAIDIQRYYQVSFWDAMVLHSASCLECNLIWSEDLSDDQMYNSVQVKDPFSEK
jgi:predicted nucleic acid-binding protein